MSVYAAVVHRLYVHDSIVNLPSCTVSSFKESSLGKYSSSPSSTAPYHDYQSVDLTNGGTRETEQELYASPHLPTQSTQVADGGDHQYCYIDAAHTESGGHSDSTVLYEDPTSPSYVVCHWVFTAALHSDCALYSVVVLSLLRDCLTKHFCPYSLKGTPL